MDTSKLTIKYGPLEIHYEGSEAFLKDELPEILNKVAALNIAKAETSVASSNLPETASHSGASKGHSLTTGSIAAKIGCSSGPDLAKAAAAHLMIFGGKPSVSRAELLKEMKGATSYFKSSYGGNLTKILKSLVQDGVFLETSSGVYALAAAPLAELKIKVHG